MAISLVNKKEEGLPGRGNIPYRDMLGGVRVRGPLGEFLGDRGLVSNEVLLAHETRGGIWQRYGPL